MKKILFTVLLTSMSLLAADNAKVVTSDEFTPASGPELYQQNCALCHGKDGRKVPTGASSILAGRDAVRLALTIRSYRDQDNDIGAYTMHKSNQIMKDQTVKYSDRQIGSMARYISGLE